MSGGRFFGSHASPAMSPIDSARLERGAVNMPSSKLTSSTAAPSVWAAIARAFVTIFSVAR